jgi:hypothetical protein
MNRHRLLALVAVVCFCAICSPAVLALTIEQKVTQQYLEQHPNQFKITAEQRDDSLIHFKIIFNLKEPRYLVSHFTARNAMGILAQSHCPLFAREHSATFYVDVSKECLADSQFTLSEHSFTTTEGQDVAMPGGTEYVIRLKDFAPASK